MNIQQAKEELKRTAAAYTAKAEGGGYRIPPLRQRPVLLIGPPGIGKTAIVEQAARECGLGFVAYTMTHHTRQSAVGLPLIEEHRYGGRRYKVTEYTMSEILASVYQCIEDEGRGEGILFLDEINCVSETLAPVMLQFLQNKTFGTHRLPEGWMIVAAGNPREYNKSVRDFDLVTLDRVRLIQVEPDLEAWKIYGARAGIHGAILSYLYCRPGAFYCLNQRGGEKEYVTARGWEDFSVLLKEYERMQFPVTEDFVREFLNCEEVAADFLSYYRLCSGGESQNPVKQILEGELGAREQKRLEAQWKEAKKEQAFALVWKLAGAAQKGVKDWERECRRETEAEQLWEDFCRYERAQTAGSLFEKAEIFLDERVRAAQVKETAGLLTEEEKWQEKEKTGWFRERLSRWMGEGMKGMEEAAQAAEAEFKEKRASLKKQGDEQSERLKRASAFLEKAFGAGDKLFCFWSTIAENPAGAHFLEQHEIRAWRANEERQALSKEKKRLEEMLS